MIPFIAKFDQDNNPTTLTGYLDGRPFTIDSATRFFNEVNEGLKTNDVERVRKFLYLKQSVAKFSSGAFTLYDDSLTYNGKEVNLSVVERILELFKQGFDIQPVLNFVALILQNPNLDSQKDTYRFMEYNELPITPDGFVLAYKMVDRNYKDIYSHTIDNRVNQKPYMDRSLVCADRNVTCAPGFHFCSLHYVETSGWGSESKGDRLIVVKINPKDIVSIPTDYNNAKGRCNTYEVVGELTWGTHLPKLVDMTGVEKTVTATVAQDVTEEEEKREPLTDQKVRDIRKMSQKKDRKTGHYLFTLTHVGNLYGVHRSTVQRIRDGLSHLHVK